MPSKLGPHFQKIPQSFDEWIAAGTSTFKFAQGQGASAQLPEGALAVGRNEDPRNWKQLKREGHSAKKTADIRFKSRQSEYEHPANARIDVWEDDNEVVPDNEDEWKFFNEYSIAMMRHYESIGKIRANFSFAVGTPEIGDWRYLMDAIRHANAHGHYIAVHEYMAMEKDLGVGWNQVKDGKKERTHWHGRVDARNNPILEYPYGYGVLRYRAVYDRFLRPAGLEDTPLIITECGCDELSFTPRGMSKGSWTAHKGQWAREGKDPERHYAEMLQWYDTELRRDAYVKGAFIFTVGYAGQWAGFEIAATGVEKHLLAYIRSQRAVVDVPFDKPRQGSPGTGGSGHDNAGDTSRIPPIDPSDKDDAPVPVGEATVKLRQSLTGFDPSINAVKLVISREQDGQLSKDKEIVVRLPAGSMQVDLLLLTAVFDTLSAPPVDPGGKGIDDVNVAPDARLRGIDISAYQPPAKMNYRALREAGVTFAWVRASRGSSVSPFWVVDTAYTQHLSKLEEAGILRGSYHVLYEHDPEGQARKFHALMHQSELPPMLDIEKGRYTGNLSADVVQRFLQTWTSLGGERPIIYTNESTWNELVKNPGWSRDYLLWIAHYVDGDKPTAVPAPWGRDEWRIWQYTGKGQIAGYDGEIDLNWFKGSLSDLRSLAAWRPDKVSDVYVSGWISGDLLDVEGDHATVNNKYKTVNVRAGSGRDRHPDPIGEVRSGTRVALTGPREPEFNYYPVKVRRVDLLAGTPPEPPAGKQIDLLRFMRGDPAWSFEVRHPDGSQERFQTQADPNDPNAWYYVKNQLWEHWRVAAGKIWLCSDVSPDNASDGTQRYYVVSKDGQYGSPYARTTMRIGEVFRDHGHKVQFYAQKTGAAHPEHSGQAANTTTLVAYHKNYTFNTYNQGVTLDEVIEVQGNTETHWFAVRNGVSLGRVAWKSAWGRSEISEIHAPGQRDPHVRARMDPLRDYVLKQYQVKLA